MCDKCTSRSTTPYSVEALTAKWQAHALSRHKPGPGMITAGIQRQALAAYGQNRGVNVESRGDVPQPVQQLRDKTRARREVQHFGARPQIQALAHDGEIKDITEADVV